MALGSVHEAAFDTEKLVMTWVAGGLVAGGLVAGVVASGLAVAAGAVVAGAVAAVVVAPLTTVDVVVDELVVEPVSAVVVFEVELQPDAASAPIASAATAGRRSLRRFVMAALYAKARRQQRTAYW